MCMQDDFCAQQRSHASSQVSDNGLSALICRLRLQGEGMLCLGGRLTVSRMHSLLASLYTNPASAAAGPVCPPTCVETPAPSQLQC